ncbi:MAG: hypothetical protein ABIR96_05470 [Bdellovibrionota bacterium]
MLKNIFSSLILLASFGAAAQSVKLGAHIGNLGTEGGSEIAYGVNLETNPYGIAAFRIDATFASFAAGNYFSTSPALVIYPMDMEEMQFGILGGAGFYKIPGDKTRFGLNYGIKGDFALGKNVTVGMEARAHPIFDVADVWTVFLTAALRFDLGGGW